MEEFNKIKKISAVIIAISAMTLTTNNAFAIGKVYSPNVVKGELEMEYLGSTTFDNNREKNALQEHEAEFEYGLTDSVKLKISGEFTKKPGESVKSEEFSLGGIYQLFEQGENWLDSGILLSYNRAAHTSVDPDSIEARLLLEKQSGEFLHRANIGIEEEIGAHRSGGPKRKFLWSSRYRYSKYFEPGFEVQSNFGKANETNHFNQQEHYIGPAIYGEIDKNIKYEAAYYKGISDASANGAARILLEYEIYF